MDREALVSVLAAEINGIKYHRPGSSGMLSDISEMAMALGP
jgi:hypothetical protein